MCALRLPSAGVWKDASKQASQVAKSSLGVYLAAGSPDGPTGRPHPTPLTFRAAEVNSPAAE
eukprot:7247484-Pyramimonas_sp.AAC.1